MHRTGIGDAAIVLAAALSTVLPDDARAPHLGTRVGDGEMRRAAGTRAGA